MIKIDFGLFLASSIGASSKIVTSFEAPVAVVACADDTRVETKEIYGADTDVWLHREVKLTCESK